MKKLQKKIETILQKINTQAEKYPEMSELEEISQLLETVEKMASQRLDDKDFLKSLKKLKPAHLLETLKSAYDPVFLVTDLTDVKEKILTWLTSTDTESNLSLGDIFQDYIEKGES